MVMHAVDGDKPVLSRRRVRRLIVAALVVVGIGWFGRFAYLRITLEPTPRPEYWARQLEKLDPPPDGAASAEKVIGLLQDRPFEAAFAAASTQPAVQRAWWDETLVLYGPWDDSRPEIVVATKIFESQEFISRRKAMIDLSRRHWAIIMPPTPRGFATHLSSVRQWAKWLIVHSRWSIEHARDPSAAVEDWLTVLRLSRDITRGGVVIHHLVGVSMIALTAQEMMYARDSARALPDSRGLVTQIDEVIGPVSLEAVYGGERLLTHSLLEHWYVREGGDWLAVNHASQNYWTTGGRTPAGVPSPIWNLFSPLFHDLATARADVDCTFDALSGWRDLASSWRGLPKSGRPSIDRISALDGMTGFGASSFARSAVLYFRGRMQMEASLAMIAIEQFHVVRGRYPNTLDDLHPEFLPRLPIDCADQEPLRYRVAGSTYVLYSISNDGRDDGGLIDRSKQAQPAPDWEKDADYVFTDCVRRPVPK